MVKVREDHPINEDGSVDLSLWLTRLHIDSPEQLEDIERACIFSFRAEKARPERVQSWGTNTSSFTIGLEMAEILAELHLDHEALIAAILYRSVREEQVSIEQIEEQFGQAVAAMIEGVIRMAVMSRIARHSRNNKDSKFTKDEKHKENIRKMLVALVDDVRVALIKLAERTCAIRSVKNDPSRRYAVASEVMDIYAPLAHRLGIGHIKWELEDLSFRYLQPETYKKLASMLLEKRIDRENYIERVVEQLKVNFAEQKIEAEISGRVKHIYSIWKKMQRKGIGFSQVYDIRAVRVLVKEPKDCYIVLGLVHGQWRNIPREFDDYIANPKDNGYRSLHTAVIGPEGKVLEIQIRTHEMHEESELGVCSHWRYKNADSEGNKSYEEKIAWLRQVLEWQEELEGDAVDVATRFSKAEERVYVFTPKGHVINLAKGCTPLDFAYHIHTEVGNKCRGARINGKLVALNYVLETGDQVEIITSQEETAPRREWLQANSGYLRSARARARVKAWFKDLTEEENIHAGRMLVEKTFERLALTSFDYKAVSKRFGYQSVEEMYAAVGAGEISSAALIKKTSELLQLESKTPVAKLSANKDDVNYSLKGAGRRISMLATCCKPTLGDDIIGFVNESTVSVHRADCSRALHLQITNPADTIKLVWDLDDKQQISEQTIAIKAFDRLGLLNDITRIFYEAGVEVFELHTETDRKQDIASMQISIAVNNLEALDNLLVELNILPNVIRAERIAEKTE